MIAGCPVLGAHGRPVYVTRKTAIAARAYARALSGASIVGPLYPLSLGSQYDSAIDEHWVQLNRGHQPSRCAARLVSVLLIVLNVSMDCVVTSHR